MLLTPFLEIKRYFSTRYRVFWTDESKFEFFGHKRAKRCWRRSGEKLNPKCINKTFKHGGWSIMVWGGMSAFGNSRLRHIKGIMDKNMYHKILVHYAVKEGRQLIGEPFIFQEDNDPKHASKLCRNYLTKLEQRGVLIRMIWPSQSPDLNPIEHMWEFLDRQIIKTEITNKDQLFDELNKIWVKIGVRVIRKYINSMQRRCIAVIKAKGGHTKY